MKPLIDLFTGYYKNGADQLADFIAAPDQTARDKVVSYYTQGPFEDPVPRDPARDFMYLITVERMKYVMQDAYKEEREKY